MKNKIIIAIAIAALAAAIYFATHQQKIIVNLVPVGNTSQQGRDAFDVKY